MNNKRRESIALAWTKAVEVGVDRSSYEQYEHAVDTMINLCQEDPKEAWEIIKTIYEKTPSQYALEVLAAGPLELLMCEHGGDIIDSIKKYVLRNEGFKGVMSYVLLDSSDTKKYLEFYAIADVDPPLKSREC